MRKLNSPLHACLLAAAGVALAFSSECSAQVRAGHRGGAGVNGIRSPGAVGIPRSSRGRTSHSHSGHSHIRSGSTLGRSILGSTLGRSTLGRSTLGRSTLGRSTLGRSTLGHSHLGRTSSIYRSSGLNRGYSSYHSPLSYASRYSRIPIIGPVGVRTASPYHRRGPSSVSVHFRNLPIYRSSYYPYTYGYSSLRYSNYGYPFYGFTTYGYPTYGYPLYAPTYCPTFGYSSFGFSISALSPTVLIPPTRITSGSTLASTLLTSLPSTRATSLRGATSTPVWRAAESSTRSPMLRYAGDSYFAAGRYLEAVASYTSAVESAPSESESLFRLGHALTAAGEFDSSSRAFKAAISLAPDLKRGDFQLNQLYGAALADKPAHLERLAAHTLARANDPNGFFLVGLFLKYDGQHERATKFFERAAKLDAEAVSAREMLTAPVSAIPASDS